MMMASHEAALAFVRTLKADFPNYKQFAEALTDFSEGEIDSATLVSRVSVLLQDHRDYSAAFKNFVPAEMPRRDLTEAAIEFVKRVREISPYDVVYASFLRSIADFRIHKDIARVDKEISDLFRDKPELYVEFTRFTVNLSPAVTVRAPFTVKKRHISRSEIELQICEDELFESDHKFHLIESTMMATEEFKETVEKDNNGEGSIVIQDYYSPTNLYCIKQMYGRYAGRMIKFLQTEPVDASSVLLDRLKLKLEEVKNRHEWVKKSFQERGRETYLVL